MNTVFLIRDPSPHNFFLWVYEVLIWSLPKQLYAGKFCYGVHRLHGRMCRNLGCTKGFTLDRLRSVLAVMWDFIWIKCSSIMEWKICKWFTNRSFFDALYTSKVVISGSIKLYADSCTRAGRFDERNELLSMKIDTVNGEFIMVGVLQIVQKTVKCRWFGYITLMITVTLH
jgi:hypothetical protein